MKISRLTKYAIPGLMLVSFAISGCYQGEPSSKPPIRIDRGMGVQPKYLPQSRSAFFKNGATMREPVPGTVAQGEFHKDVAYYTGKDEKGNYVKTFPDTVVVDMALLKRGQERFNIYCSPCHSRLADGRGIVVSRGMVPPPSFHDKRFLDMPGGQFFETMTNGLRNMPSYRFQVPVHDRWAIIAYIRALQRSENATIKDVPEAMRDKVK